MLSAAELDTLVPALLLSNGQVLIDQPVKLRDLITSLAEVELPGHTEQLLALLPEDARVEATPRDGKVMGYPRRDHKASER